MRGGATMRVRRGASVSVMLDGFTTPLELEGVQLGPVTVSVTGDRIRFYSEVTGDDPDRWTASAPPGLASLMLFAVADLFLYHPAVVPFTATLLHLDQSFTYHAPMRTDSEVTMVGTITRVRERSGSYFVTFDSTGHDERGLVLDSSSTFVLSDRAAPAPIETVVEPPVRERSSNRDGMRSASRHDLVRYAAATRDFNPLHWDHEVAVAAGLPGTVVHGLLMYAWMLQGAAAATTGRDVAAAKVRFRAALHPAEPAEVTTTVDTDTVKVDLKRGDDLLVSGTVTMAEE